MDSGPASAAGLFKAVPKLDAPQRLLHARCPVAQVELTRHLKIYFPQLAAEVLSVDAASVAEVISKLEVLAPGFAFYVCDERGRLRQHVNVFVNEEMVADRRALSDQVQAQSRVFIAQALSGG